MNNRQLKYKAHYDKLVQRGQKRASSKKEAKALLGYCEKHHVIPKCMGGTNERENLVYLSAREHYVAHQLLVMIYPEVGGLKYAALMMCLNSTNERMNNRSYSWLKTAAAIAQSKDRTGKTKDDCPRVAKMAKTKTGRTKETHEGTAAQADAIRGRSKEADVKLAERSERMLGQTKETSESVAQMAETLTGRTKENHEGPRKISEALTGRSKETHEYLAIQSSNRTGQTKENNESVARQAEKITGRTKETHDGLRIISEKLTGRSQKTHEYLAIRAAKQKILSLELITQLIELRNSGMKFKQIHQLFLEQGIEISYSALPIIYKREIKLREAL